MASPLTYRQATGGDHERLIAFILEHTLAEEPTCVGLQYTEVESMPVWTMMVHEALQQRVSYLAFDVDILVGFRLCSVKDIAEATRVEASDDEAGLMENARIVLKYLRAIDRVSIPNIPITTGHYLKVALTTVRPDYMRRGIASTLMRLSNDRSKEFKCQGVYTQAVAYKSQQMYMKHGWTLLGEVLHADILNGKGERAINCPEELRTDRGHGMWMGFA